MRSYLVELSRIIVALVFVFATSLIVGCDNSQTMPDEYDAEELPIQVPSEGADSEEGEPEWP